MPKPNEVPKEILIAASAAEQVRQRNAATAVAEADEVESMKTVAGALTAMGSATSPDDEQRQLMKILIENLSHDMAKKRKKEAEEEDNLRRLMLAQADSIKHEKARKLAIQTYCQHLKENGRSRVCGQKLSNGHLSLICSLCYREWDETTLPPHLQVSYDDIGG